MAGVRNKTFVKAGVSKNPKRRFSEGGKKKSTRKYACGGKLKK